MGEAFLDGFGVALGFGFGAIVFLIIFMMIVSLFEK